MKFKIILFISLVFQMACGNSAQQMAETPVAPAPQEAVEEEFTPKKPIIVGAARMDEYLHKLEDKNIALVVNQTSMIGKTHLADVLVDYGIKVKTIFAPEHGFRGTADAGEHVKDGKDAKTGVPLISLYGKNKKPKATQLEGIDMVVFDIQDVGARFYTYISTMHYVMEACAESEIAFLVLDRPNPNGNYVDGPILQAEAKSFIGMHPIPVVHGMTVAEYAQMINGEGWLKGGLVCDLSYVLCDNYTHDSYYNLPVKPSPNLPNNRAIILYPSLCFFEGTNASVGRGTNTQFQVYGHPDFSKGNYSYTPKSMPGAKSPKHKGKFCKGFSLTNELPEDLHQVKQLNLSYLIDFYQDFPDKNDFFLKNLFFDKLAGGKTLREQIIAGKTETEIRASWEDGLSNFKKIRGQYLLYP